MVTLHAFSQTVCALESKLTGPQLSQPFQPTVVTTTSQSTPASANGKFFVCVFYVAVLILPNMQPHIYLT